MKKQRFSGRELFLNNLDAKTRRSFSRTKILHFSIGLIGSQREQKPGSTICSSITFTNLNLAVIENGNQL